MRARLAVVALFALLLVALMHPLLARAQGPGLDSTPSHIHFERGTVLNPSITFWPDETTGLYLYADGELGFTANGLHVARVTGSGFLYATGFIASDRFYSPNYSDLGGLVRLALTINGKMALVSATTLTGGEDIGNALQVNTDFSAADKVVQVLDNTTTELASIFGDGALQLDGTVTSDGTGTSDFDGPVTAPGFVADKCDSTGTPGAATCDTYAGRAAVAIGAASVVITDSLVSATSSVFAQLASANATCLNVTTVVPAAGSFTISVNAACTVAAANVAWEVR